MRGMDEHDCASSAQSVPDGRERRVAKVSGRVVSIRRQENDPIGFELIEGVDDLSESLFGMAQVGNACKEAESLWLLVAKLRAVLVAASRQGCGGSYVFLDVWARRGTRQNGGGNTDLATDGIIQLDSPVGNIPARRIASASCERLGEDRRIDVMVHVDLSFGRHGCDDLAVGSAQVMRRRWCWIVIEATSDS